MIILDAPSAAPVSPYGTMKDFLAALDAMPAPDRQAAALALLNRLPVEEGVTALRRILLALLDLAIIDAATEDFDPTAQPTGSAVRHLRLLIEQREDAEQRLALAFQHVRPTDLADLLDGVARDAKAAGIH